MSDSFKLYFPTGLTLPSKWENLGNDFLENLKYPEAQPESQKASHLNFWVVGRSWAIISGCIMGCPDLWVLRESYLTSDMKLVKLGLIISVLVTFTFAVQWHGKIE